MALLKFSSHYCNEAVYVESSNVESVTTNLGYTYRVTVIRMKSGAEHRVAEHSSEVAAAIAASEKAPPADPTNRP